MHPSFHIVKCVSVCHVIDDDDSMSSSIVAAGESSEALLAGSVPLFGKIKKLANSYDLQLDNFVLNNDCLNFLKES